MNPQRFINIAAHLPEMARLQPDTTAIIFPKGNIRLSFSELNALSDRIAHGLVRNGIGRGVRSVLMVPPGPDLFALTFALFKTGAIPVLIDPGLGIKNLKACLAEAEPQAFIGIPKAHVARILFGWGKSTLKTHVTVGRRLFWRGTTLDSLLRHDEENISFSAAPTGRDDTAAILFTSGSTGPPKGAVYNHGNFCAQVELLKGVYAIRPGEIDLPTFPLFALFAPALGMSAVIPEMDFTRPGSVDAEKLCTAIRSFNVTTMFGSPALVRRVADYGVAHNVKLASLKRVISAGAPVPAAVLERFATLLDPQTQIFTPYGATEALPVCSIGSREILTETRQLTDQGKGVCIGRPVAGVEVAIVPISDEPLPFWDDAYRLAANVIGEIAVRGPQVTRRYHNRPAATDLAKILDPTSGTFWHRMGDLGYRDEQGRLWFCGRKSHRVRTATGELYTIPCEAIFNTHPQVYRSALVGIGRPGAQKPVLCVELQPGIKAEAQALIRAELLVLGQKQALTREVRTILFHPAFPVDIRHNA